MLTVLDREEVIILLQLFSRWHPELIALELILLWLYAYANAHLDRKAAMPATKRQRISFLAFLVSSYVALGSPMDTIAQNQSFLMFVIQAMLMTLVMPWLLLAAIPTWMTKHMFRVAWVFRVVKVLTQPVVAVVLYSTVMSISLLPSVFEATLTYNWLHIVDTSALMLAGLCLWWPLVSKAPEMPRMNHSTQLVYMLFSANLMMPIPFFLIASGHIWYKSYLNAELFNILADQHLGGTLFLLGMVGVFGVRALLTLASYERSVSNSNAGG